MLLPSRSLINSMSRIQKVRDVFSGSLDLSKRLGSVRSSIQERIEENRAEDKVKVMSDGPVELEYVNNWREDVNQINDDERLEFQCRFKKIKKESGEFFVFNLRTPNLVSSGDDRNDNDSTEDEPDDEEESENQEESDEETVEEKLPSDLKLKVEDENEVMESFDLDLIPSSDQDNEDQDGEEYQDMEEQDEEGESLRKPDTVDKLYLDLCQVFADNPSEQQDNVYVAFQQPVVRHEFGVEDLDEAERIVENTVQRLDEKTIESELEEAYEDGDIGPEN